MSELCKSACHIVEQQLKPVFPKQRPSGKPLGHDSWEMEETKALRVPPRRAGAAAWQVVLVVPAFPCWQTPTWLPVGAFLFLVTVAGSLIENAESWKGVILFGIFWSVAAEPARPASPERLIPGISAETEHYGGGKLKSSLTPPPPFVEVSKMPAWNINITGLSQSGLMLFVWDVGGIIFSVVCKMVQISSNANDLLMSTQRAH